MSCTMCNLVIIMMTLPVKFCVSYDAVMVSLCQLSNTPQSLCVCVLQNCGISKVK